MPASVASLKKSWWALAFGAAFLLAACGGSLGGGRISGDSLSAPLPAELSKVTLTTDNLVVKVTLEDKASSTSKTYTLALTSVDSGAGTFAGRLPGIAPGDYKLSLTFIIKDSKFGDVIVATAGSTDVTVENGKETAVDTSAFTTTYLNDDGDAFTNLDELDAGTDPAAATPSVALFNNTSYVKYASGDTSAAASNLEASLKTGNIFVQTFNGITAADINAATKNADVLVIPDLVAGSLAADLTAEASTALAGFAARGGTVVMFLATHGNNVALATNAFGFGLGTVPGAATTLNPRTALGTPFAGGPAGLPVNTDTTLVAAGSLTKGLEPVYGDGPGDAAVASVPFGAGRVILLGWNWTNAAPTGTQDGGWIAMLLRAADQFQHRPKVALMANTKYVDYIPGNSSSEASNMEAGINDMGVPVTTFTDISATGIAKAVTGNDVLVMPELETSDVTPDLDAAAQEAIRTYVAAGGTIVANYPSSGLNFVNTVFGLTLAGGSGGVTSTIDPVMAVDTPFVGGPVSLPPNNATATVTQASLPAGSRAVYHDASGNTAVAVIPFGSGRIVVLAWDWYNAVPVGTGSPQDGGWLSVLNAALHFAPAKVAMVANGSFVDYIIGNSSSEASNVEAAFDRVLGIPVVSFQGVTAADLTAAVAGRKVLMIPEMERGDLTPALDPTARAVISDFVNTGGTLVISRQFGGNDVNLLNAVFGFSLVAGSGALPDTAGATLDTAAAAGTPFADGVSALPQSSATGSYHLASLPAGSTVIYADATVTPGDPVVAIIPFGTGRIVVLGWDFFDAAPVGSTDGGWLYALKAAAFMGLP